MSANLENSEVATGLEKVIFHSNAKECWNCHTIVVISHASKVMLKVLQARLQQYMNQEFADVQAWFRKGRGTRGQIANICWIIRRRQWHPTPVLLPGKSHGWRSLVGCSPWGLEESDTTERLYFHFSLSFIGEGNGNHSSIFAWRIPGTAEPGGLPSMGSHRVGHNWSDLAAAAAAGS